MPGIESYHRDRCCPGSAFLRLRRASTAPQAKGPAGPPVVPVSVAKATQESVPTELRVVGTVEASSIVQVKSQIAGQLLKAAFTEGQNVNKDDLLFEIDPRPYEEALRQAEANVARDQAQIAQRKPPWRATPRKPEFNEGDAARYAELAKAGVVSKSQSDQARTSADVARESARATQAAHRKRQGGARERSLRGGHGEAESDLLHDPLAAQRTHRQPAGARRKPGEGQRRAAGGDQPGVAHLRQFQRAGTAPGRHPPAERQPQARRPRVRAGRPGPRRHRRTLA